jgi:hypothetical protein
LTEKKKRNFDIQVTPGLGGTVLQKPAVARYQTENRPHAAVAGGEQRTVHI